MKNALILTLVIVVIFLCINAKTQANTIESLTEKIESLLNSPDKCQTAVKERTPIGYKNSTPIS